MLNNCRNNVEDTNYNALDTKQAPQSEVISDNEKYINKQSMKSKKKKKEAQQFVSYNFTNERSDLTEKYWNPGEQNHHQAEN